MAFCINCGQELSSGAKFCSGCGTAIHGVGATASQRKTTYDGVLHKCPQCGEVLDSFTTVCPSCSYEIRGASTSNAVKEFASKLDKATTDYQKTNIIRSFPIPNTKEDILEFIILAASNIDENPNKVVFDSWMSKFNQAYEKGKILFTNSTELVTINQLNDRVKKVVKRRNRKTPKRIALIILGVIIVPFLPAIIILLIGGILMIFNPEYDEEEVARLEAIVVEVECALENEEYDLAMMHAKTIDYDAFRANDELERQWDIKRDYLIKQIIDAAAEDGITMEYPTDTADEKDQENSSGSYDYEKNDQEMQENIDEFNKSMEEVESMWDQYINTEPVE